MLAYFSKVYHLGEEIKVVKDTRVDLEIKIYTVSLLVLMGFILQVPSFNRLEHWIRKGKFRKLLPQKTKLPSIDTIRLALDKIDRYKVCAIDGVELFESTEKCCDDCLTRVDKAGVTHYFYRDIVCMIVGSDPHIILGKEMLKPKNDGSDKDEGELTGGKRLIENLHDEYGHFADVIVADALYMKAPWI